MPSHNKPRNSQPDEGGGQMLNFGPEIIEDAREVAREMEVAGEKIRPFTNIGGKIIAFVSSDPNAIQSLTSFKVGDKTYYLGNEKE